MKISENNPGVKQIDLRDLFDVLKKNIVMIVIAAVGSYVWTKTNYVPAYRSTATLYLLRQYRLSDNEQLAT